MNLFAIGNWNKGTSVRQVRQKQQSTATGLKPLRRLPVCHIFFPAMSRMLCLTLIGLFLLADSRPAASHHGTSTYDMNVEIRLAGTVKEWTFTNPHSWLWLIVPGRGSATEEWSIESAPPSYLSGQGWSAATLKSGEKLTVLISPLKGEPRRGILLEVLRSDGRSLIVRPRGSFGRPAAVQQPK